MSTTGTLTIENDTLTGYIADLAFDTDITLAPNARKTDDKHPDYIVNGLSPRGRDIPLGAAWWRISKAGNRYLSLALNILGQEHHVNAVTEDGTEFRIIAWA